MKTLFSQQHGMKEADWEQNGKLVFDWSQDLLQHTFFSLPFSLCLTLASEVGSRDAKAVA